MLVINSGVPWMPKTRTAEARAPRSSTSRIDPLVSRHPFREYEADLLVTGDAAAALAMPARSARARR